MRSAGKLRAPPPWASLLAIFVASLVVVHGWSGTSPALWLDTLNDDREVRACVAGSCSLVGQAASIDGLFVAGGWLHVRSLLFALGAGISGVHLGIQALDALGVVLVALAGFRVGGRPVGAIAVFVAMHELGRGAAAREAVYNTSPLAFFGAVLLLACLAAAQRPTVWPAVVVALLAAVMTDCHACCAPAGATAVAIAWIAPGRRLPRALAAALVFAAATFAIAPLAWIENVGHVVHAGPVGGGSIALSPLAAASAVWGDSIARYSLLALGAWLAAAVTRRDALRRRLDVPAAVLAPMMAAFVFGVAHGVGDGGGKYLAHLKPAAALGFAAAAWAVAQWLLARWPGGRRLERASARFLPWAAALAVALMAAPGGARGRRGLPIFTVADLDAFVRVLRDERGWSRARVFRRVQSLETPTILAGMFDEDDRRRDPPEPPGSDDDLTEAFLLALDRADLPDPLPAGWTVARRSASTAAVIVFARSRLDWRRLELCVDGERGRCVHAGELGPDAPPVERLPNRARIVLRVPLLPGSTSTLFIPRLLGRCTGSIVSVSGPGSHVEADGRHATLAATPAGADPGGVEIEWSPGSAACPSYFGLPRPPFFVEADPEVASTLEAVLRRGEP